MAKTYTPQTWVDEVLDGAEVYDIDGGGIGSDVVIALSTTVLTPGTTMIATRLNNIETGIDDLDTLLRAAPTEKTVAAGVLTVDQSRHTIQPQSGTTDDINTINDIEDGTLCILTAADEGTDTLTFKHGTGNLSCFGAADLALSHGAVFAFRDGATVYVAGGGGGGGNPLEVEDESSSLATEVTKLNFLGAGVNAVENATNEIDITIAGGGTAVNPNMLINGQFRVAQRGTAFISTGTFQNDDAKYTLDRWALLSDGDDIVDVTQELSVVPNQTYSAIKLEVETINKQFGILQILEARDCEHIIGSVCSLSIDVRMAAADDNTHSIKVAVISWDGTEDSPTLDVVGTWGATVTLAANWTLENSASSRTLTTSWQTITITNISIDTASTKNVAVFIYCDQTNGALDDAIYISNVKLEAGASSTAFITRPIAEEIDICHRYLEVFGGESSFQRFGVGYVTTTAIADTVHGMSSAFRVKPTLSYTALSDFRIQYGGNSYSTPTAIALNGSGRSNIGIRWTATGTPLTVDVATLISGVSGTAPRLVFDAEIGV